MFFDAIVGNPPYQQITEHEDYIVPGAVPLYQHFVDQAKSINPQYVSFIIPAKWLGGEGRNLERFRHSMLTDPHLQSIYDFEDASAFFPDACVMGGVLFFLRNTSYISYRYNTVYFDRENDSVICNRKKTTPLEKEGLDYQAIRDLRFLPIIEKVTCGAPESAFMRTQVSVQSPFGMPTHVRPNGRDPGPYVTLHYRGGSGPYPIHKVTQNLAYIDLWKVITPRCANESSHYPIHVFRPIRVIGPGEICTGTYLVIGATNTQTQAENLKAYLQTRFVQFLVMAVTHTQQLSKRCFMFVPIQDWGEHWDDEKLYEKYQLSKQEIALIESMVKVRK